jgi:hypothetical protein
MSGPTLEQSKEWPRACPSLSSTSTMHALDSRKSESTMNTVIRSSLVALALTMPAFAATRPPAESRTVTVSEREFARSEVAPTEELISTQPTSRELTFRIEALQLELARVRGEQIERLPVVGDSNSHPMWP